MHSYRHGFHAANHADVLKHAVLVQILDYFTRKDTAFHVIDTHAGAGLYDLQHEWSQQSGEAADGALRLAADSTASGLPGVADPRDVESDTHASSTGIGDAPPLIARYLQALAQCHAEYGEQVYPGSPWLALQALRPADRLHLFETHPSEIENLTLNLRQRRGTPPRQVTLRHSDGFAGLRALLPPPSRRAVVIMDPSYEEKQDYRRVVQSLREGLERFATGCYAIWHPIVQRPEVDEMIRSLKRLPGLDWLHATLLVRQAPRDGFGLYGSGMFIVNPPWQLRDELAQALPWLRDRLAQDSHARIELTDAAQAPATGAAPARRPAATGRATPRDRQRDQKNRSPSGR